MLQTTWNLLTHPQANLPKAQVMWSAVGIIGLADSLWLFLLKLVLVKIDHMLASAYLK